MRTGYEEEIITLMQSILIELRKNNENISELNHRLSEIERYIDGDA